MFNNNWLANSILFLGLFTLTLTSYGIYSFFIGAGILVFYLLISKTARLQRSVVLEIVAFLILLMIAVIRFQTIIIQNTIPIFSVSFYGNLARYLLLILIWLELRLILKNPSSKKLVIKFIPKFLVIHVGVFFIQFFLFMSSGFYLDLVEPITGEVSRYITFDSSLMSGIGSFRPTGFYIEPSTYFYAILALFLMLIHSYDSRKYKALQVFTLISMYLNFSTAAIIITTLLVVYLLIFKIRKLKVYFGVFALIIMLVSVFPNKLNTLFESQQNKFGRSEVSRTNMVNYLIMENKSYPILSYGAFALPTSVAKATTLDSGNRSMASINDAGLLVYLWIVFGYWGIFCFIILGYFFFKSDGFDGLAFFIILSLTKIPIFTPLFLFFGAYILTRKEEKTEWTRGKNYLYKADEIIDTI